MQVTSIGHAGFHVRTGAGSVLCDPWVNPAYFASWFPFPDNTALDWDALGACDFLYVSHLHKDHFDPELLRAHVNKDATVLLPDYPVPDLRRELEALGFHDFLETTTETKHRVTGRDGHVLDLMIIALRSPAAQDFLAGRIFWDAKRPISKAVLQKLDLQALLSEGKESGIGWTGKQKRLAL